MDRHRYFRHRSHWTRSNPSLQHFDHNIGSNIPILPLIYYFHRCSEYSHDMSVAFLRLLFGASDSSFSVALIVYRIWIIDRVTFNGKSKLRSPLRRVIRIIIESGMVYTITVLLGTASLLAGSNGVYITGRVVCFNVFCCSYETH